MWHKNNIKRATKGILQFFLPKWGPRFWNKPLFWNTFAADQQVFQNRGFTVYIFQNFCVFEKHQQKLSQRLNDEVVFTSLVAEIFGKIQFFSQFFQQSLTVILYRSFLFGFFII